MLMRKLLLSLLVALLFNHYSNAAGGEDSLKAYEMYIDSIERTLRYETGKVVLPDGTIELNMPAGFRFLNKEQSNFILTDLWNNPLRQDVLGMLFPEDSRLSSDSTYAFIISFDPIGYVKDKDADKIDYDQLLADMKSGEAAGNARRASLGYDAIHLIGWAQEPYYDRQTRVLHWAKELKFGEDNYSTLNYDIRVLGRKGVLSLNAIGAMHVLDEVKKDIDKVLTIATFTPGNRYVDFDPKTDEVAAWTVGGLVAGKILVKAGAFKFLKIAVIAIAALLAGGWKWRSWRRKGVSLGVKG
jgi:uncharacterized membrane-anchored protein